MRTFKHSGATGDLLYSLPIVKQLGGGDFCLHLDQMNWIGQHYYGSIPAPFHQNRLNSADFEYMRDFMLAQEYITDFRVLDPQRDEVTHNLDRFRPAFVGHPGNYVDIYANTFGITDSDTQTQIRKTPWLTVPKVTQIPGRPIVINRTQRWLPPQPGAEWEQWLALDWDQEAVFVGLPNEYVAFQQQIGWNIPYQETRTQLELAQIIAGAKMFIGNQSQALALSIGLGVHTFCEIRRDLPLERNECYFPTHPRVRYF